MLARRPWSVVVVLSAYLAGPLLASPIAAYQPHRALNLPVGCAAFGVLPDGRTLCLVGADLHLESGPGSGMFVPAGTLPGADIGDFGAAFCVPSPDGMRIAVGNNGGADFGHFQIGIFTIDDLTGQWFDLSHHAATWFGNDTLLFSGGAFFEPSVVTALVVDSDPGAPNVRTVIAGIGGASGGVALDAEQRLWTANGFDYGKGGSSTGWIKVFAADDWQATLFGSEALDFENNGTVVADLLSAASLAFDRHGHLIVGGGDFATAADHGYAALVDAAAWQSAMAGGPRVVAADGAVRWLDPDPAAGSYYTVTTNRALSEILLVGDGAVHSVQAPMPFATRVIDYRPMPGQHVALPAFNDPTRALGPPSGGGIGAADNTGVVTLGGFGGTMVLGFDHTVRDDPDNPLGIDAIVFGNAFWVGGQPHRRWAESATIEISQDADANGLPDDPWYLIPGSHVADTVFAEQCWDDLIADASCPPTSAAWIPEDLDGTWTSSAWALPDDPFADLILDNPLGADSPLEGLFGYADHSPTLRLGDFNADDTIDAPTQPALFYTVPDDPFTVGIDAGAGGGDGFDIAWAIDPATGMPAELEGFDFIRLTTAVDHVDALFGEVSAEIDAVADVASNTPHLRASLPADLSIDARQPHAPDDSAQRSGWDVVTLVFAEPPVGLTPQSVTVTSTDGVAPLVDMVMIDETVATLVLDRPIPAGAWTDFVVGSSAMRLGHLPGDVDGDGFAGPLDVVTLIDALNGVATRPAWSTDLDRSGVTAPLDILRAIDLLNGAGAFEAWNGRSLP